MKEELESIEKNKTWDLVYFLEGKSYRCEIGVQGQSESLIRGCEAES